MSDARSDRFGSSDPRELEIEGPTEPTREEVRELIYARYGRDLAAVRAAGEVVEAYVRDHPEDLEVAMELESLVMLESALGDLGEEPSSVLEPARTDSETVARRS